MGIWTVVLIYIRKEQSKSVNSFIYLQRIQKGIPIAISTGINFIYYLLYLFKNTFAKSLWVFVKKTTMLANSTGNPVPKFWFLIPEYFWFFFFFALNFLQKYIIPFSFLLRGKQHFIQNSSCSLRWHRLKAPLSPQSKALNQEPKEVKTESSSPDAPTPQSISFYWHLCWNFF